MRSHAAVRATAALVLREMATAHGRVPGGYLWAVAEPVAAVALLAGIFAMAFDQPPLGRDFALFYASGYLPFMLYGDLAQKIGVALRFSRPLLGYPAVTWGDAIAARFVLNTLTHLVIAVLVLGGCLWLAGGPVLVMPGPLALGFGLAALLGLGIGALNAFLFEAAPIWERIWAILNRPLFILSGVLFLPDAVPRPHSGWLEWNPLVHVIAVARAGLYPTYRPDWTAPGFVLGLAALCGVAGLWALHRRARHLLAAG